MCTVGSLKNPAVENVVIGAEDKFAGQVLNGRLEQLSQLWHDRAVFHFLTDKKSRDLYVKSLKDALPSGGYAIIATFAKDGPKKCSGLEIVQYDSLSIQKELGTDFIFLEEQSEIHHTPKGSEQHFIYFLFQRI